MAPARIYQSHLNIDIPGIDVPSFVFSSGTPESRNKPQYFDAAEPWHCYSLNQAEVYVKRIAKGLLDNLGIKPNEKVLVFSGNKLFYPVLVWSVIAAQAVFSGSSPAVFAKELAHQMRDSDARFVFASAEVVQTAKDAMKLAGLGEDKLYIFSDPHDPPTKEVVGNVPDWTTLWASESEVRNWHWKKINSAEEADRTTAVINYSSGTTGLPKGVEISHRNCVANSAQAVYKRSGFADNERGRARQAIIKKYGERWIAPLPMYHAYGQNYFCFNAARQGAKVFIMRKFDIEKYLLYIDIYSINFLTGAPAIISRMAKYEGARKYNLGSLLTVGCGSAPLGQGVNELFSERFLPKGRRITQGWGMSEVTCSATGFAPDENDDGSSVGWLNPNIKAKIVEVEGQEYETQADGAKPGELWVAGPNVMMGYYKKPEETKECIVEEDGVRWLRTGDIGYFDKNENLYIVDRLKELIKVKGLQVAPAEIELTLLTHDGVADCAVKSEKKGDEEYPQAFVVKARENVTEAELHDFLKSQLAKHKWLTGGIFWIGEIPRTHSGKIKRRELPKKPIDNQTKPKL